MKKKYCSRKIVMGCLLGMGILLSRTYAQESESTFDISKAKVTPLPKGIVATYQGGEVTDKQWKDYLLKVPFQEKGSPLTPEDVSWKHKLIKEYVGDKLALENAIKAKLDETPEFKKGYQDLKDRLMMDTLFTKEVREKAVPTEDEMKKYYDGHSEQFASPETFSIRHIFVDTSKTRKTEAEKAEALKKIQEAYAKLQKGESFESVAKVYSEASPEDKRGEVNGPFKRGDILIDIETTALSLQDGHYSGIISTKHGYTIVYLEEHKLAHINDFNDVKESVKNVLESQKIPGLRDKTIKEARDNTKAVTHYEYLTDPKAKNSSVLFELPGLKMTLGELREREKGSSSKITADQEKQFLDGLILNRQLMLLAEKLKMDKDPAVVNGLADFKKLKLVEAWFNKKVDEELKITDEDLKDFYQKNTTRFVTQKQIEAHEIYIRANFTNATTMSSRSMAMSTAKDTADWISQQLKEGKDFAELAKKYSATPSAKNGGALGWIQMGPRGHIFDLAAFKLKKGETSQPIELSDGYIIIKVTGTKEPQQKTFEEAKSEVRQWVEQSKKIKLRDKVLQDELTRAKLRYDLSRL